MSTTLKTIEYAWNSDVNLLTGNIPYTSSTITIYFPETGSNRKFQSVWLELAIRDSNASTSGRAIMGNRTFGLVIDGTSTETYYAGSQTSLNDTGEQASYLLTSDFTRDFNSITGSATSSNVAFSFTYTTGSGTDPRFTNVNGKLYLTYEYDILSNRRVKTITIPCDKTGSIPLSLTEIPSSGNPQVPILDIFCPESNKIFRNVWFEVEGDEVDTSVTDSTISMSLDSESGVGLGFYELANSMGNSMKTHWVRDDIDTSTTHSIKMMRSGGAFFSTVGIFLKATYEYDHNSSNTILNSILIPYYCSSNYQPLSGVYGYWYNQFSIVEPNPIDLKQSGFWTYYGISAVGPLFSVYVNTGSAITAGFGYAANLPCSNLQVFRFDDSGSLFNCRISFVRGYNPVNIKMTYTGNSENRISGLTGYVCVNYHSGKHPLGDHVHNRTVRRLIFTGSNYSNANILKQLPNSYYTASIPDTNYYINSYGLEDVFVCGGFASKSNIAVMNMSLGENDYVNHLQFDTSSQITTDVQYPSIASGMSEEQWGRIIWSDSYGFVKKYPQQISDPLHGVGMYNLQTYHTAAIGNTFFNQLIEHFVYHGISYYVTGSLISSSLGNNDGIIIGLYKSDTRELLMTGSTGVGGSYTMSWYDNTVPVFVEAISGSTKAGRSLNQYAQ